MIEGIKNWFDQVFPPIPRIVWIPSEETRRVLRTQVEDEKRAIAMMKIPGVISGTVDLQELPNGTVVLDFDQRDSSFNPTVRLIPGSNS